MGNPIIFFITLFSLNGTAQQNLVPNPSFEEYSSCPTENELGNGQFIKCIDWWYPTPSSIGTPDYFNACNNTIGGSNQGIVGVPSNFRGYQEAYHGVAYVGLDLFDYDTLQKKIISKEMIQTRLIAPLKSCHQYKLTLYVSLANFATHSIKSLGMILSPDMIYIDDLNKKPSTWVNNLTIHDTLNWVKIGGIITALGNEQYFTLGYFNEYNSNELTFNDSTAIYTFGTYSPYYYIDSISLIEIGIDENCVPKIPNVFSPNNDQLNDEFTIKNLNLNSLVILNRWGNEMVTIILPIFKTAF